MPCLWPTRIAVAEKEGGGGDVRAEKVQQSAQLGAGCCTANAIARCTMMQPAGHSSSLSLSLSLPLSPSLSLFFSLSCSVKITIFRQIISICWPQFAQCCNVAPKRERDWSKQLIRCAIIIILVVIIRSQSQHLGSTAIIWPQRVLVANSLRLGIDSHRFAADRTLNRSQLQVMSVPNQLAVYVSVCVCVCCTLTVPRGHWSCHILQRAAFYGQFCTFLPDDPCATLSRFVALDVFIQEALHHYRPQLKC